MTTYLAHGSGRRRLLAAAAGALALALAAPASGATWAGGRTTPSLRQIVAVDVTGEPGWPYGREDVAGDGLDTFAQPEQALDLRTGYAATDATRLWLRAYVSDPNAVGREARVFAFIDADADATTGGRASAPEIDARLTTEPSPGGYDYVVGMRGDGTVENLWAWEVALNAYAPQPAPAAQAEAGRDLDPIRFGAEARGYVQANVELAAVAVTQTCVSNIFFRSVNGGGGAGGGGGASGATGAGDVDLGAFGPCVAGDGDGDGVPEVLVPPPGCTLDEQCPNRGVCVGGRCELAAPCALDAECGEGRECSDDGRCVVPGGGACAGDAQCDGVCRGGACVACTPGGAECGAGRRCGADGACVGGGGPGGAGGPSVAPGGRIEGGAFNCSAGGAGGGGAAVAALLVAIAGGRRAARRRAR